jgi:hypothetical protein
MLQERFASHLRARDANGNYITSDEKLLNYLQDPGTIPSILVLGEVERRQVENKQRQQMEAQAAGPMPTVKDQALMQQANAQNMMSGGIDNLGAQRPDMTNVPQPTEMAAADRANMPGLPALAKAGGYVADFKEGGVVGYQFGGGVNVPNTTYPNYLDQPRAFQGFDANIQATQQNIFKLKEQLAQLESEPTRRPLLISQIKEQIKAQQDYLSAPKTGGGFTPTESPMMTPDEQKLAAMKSGNTLQEDLPIGETTAGKPGLKDQPASIFEGAKLDTGKVDTRLYDELTVEDPTLYGQESKERMSEALGDEYTKAIGEQRKRIQDLNLDTQRSLRGAYFLDAAGEMFQGRVGEEGAAIGRAFKKIGEGERLTQKETNALTMKEADINLQLLKANEDRKLALEKFGMDSERYARDNNRAVQLAKQKEVMEYAKLANNLEVANISATKQGQYLSAILGGDKFAAQYRKEAKDMAMTTDRVYQANDREMLKLAEKVRQGDQKSIDKYLELQKQNQAIEDALFNQIMKDKKTMGGSSGIAGVNTGTTASATFDFVPGKGLVPKQ